MDRADSRTLKIDFSKQIPGQSCAELCISLSSIVFIHRMNDCTMYIIQCTFVCLSQISDSLLTYIGLSQATWQATFRKYLIKEQSGNISSGINGLGHD